MTMTELMSHCPEYCSNKVDMLMLCIEAVFPDYYDTIPCGKYTYADVCNMLEKLGVTEVE